MTRLQRARRSSRLFGEVEALMTGLFGAVVVMVMLWAAMAHAAEETAAAVVASPSKFWIEMAVAAFIIATIVGVARAIPWMRSKSPAAKAATQALSLAVGIGLAYAGVVPVIPAVSNGELAGGILAGCLAIAGVGGVVKPALNAMLRAKVPKK